MSSLMPRAATPVTPGAAGSAPGTPAPTSPPGCSSSQPVTVHFPPCGDLFSHLIGAIDRRAGGAATEICHPLRSVMLRRCGMTSIRGGWRGATTRITRGRQSPVGTFRAPPPFLQMSACLCWAPTDKGGWFRSTVLILDPPLGRRGDEGDTELDRARQFGMGILEWKAILLSTDYSHFSTRPWSSTGSEVGQERPCLLSQTNQFRLTRSTRLKTAVLQFFSRGARANWDTSFPSAPGYLAGFSRRMIVAGPIELNPSADVERAREGAHSRAMPASGGPELCVPRWPLC
jgi:hypothetical protein